MAKKKFAGVFLLLLTLTSFGQNLYDIDSVRTIKIYFYNKNWDSKLDSLKLNNSKERELAKLVYNNQIIDSVGIRFKGNSSYKKFYKKNPYNIKLNYTNKKANIDGYKTLKLSNLFMDPSGIREVLAYSIINKYITAPKANFINLYINDTLIGLYSNVEAINKDFIKKHFDGNKNAFFKCENTVHSKPDNCNTSVLGSLTLGFTLDSVCYYNEYEKKSKAGWSDLLELMTALWYNSDSTSKYYNTIENYIDVDKALWMLSFNNLFVNLDSYNWSGRNYYLYKTNNNKFQIIPWDYNQCFGGFFLFYNPDKLAEFPVYMSINYDYKPLISKLLSIDKYKKTYIEHYNKLIADYILNGKLEKEANKLHNLIDPYIKNDPWFYYGYGFFKESLNKTSKDKIPGILELMNKRVEYLKTYDELKFN